MTLSTTTEQQAFQGIKRVCYAGLDSLSLRAELVRRIRTAVPAETSNFSTMDPDTGLINHCFAENMPFELYLSFLGHLYPDDEAVSVLDQAAEGKVASIGERPGLLDSLREVGLEHDLRTLFFDRETLWGSLCLIRGPGSPAFVERETRFMERIAPHVSAGLRAAAIQDLAVSGEGGEAEESGAAAGFLVLDAQGRIALRTPVAAACLDDLAGPGAAAEGRLPMAVLSLRGRLLRRRAVPDDVAADARLRTRGASGTWYVLRATLSEPDAAGGCSTVVSMERVARADVGPLLFRLYGLSPREREVICWVVRGEPTKRIALHLGLSTHTVQDYLDKACEKIGVRGRKALVAKLFRDGYAPSLAA